MSGLALALGIAVLGVMIVFVSLISMSSEDVTKQGVAVGLGVVVFAAVIVALVRVKVEANEWGVDVVNYVSRKRIPWTEIERFDVGFAYWGVSLVPRSGPPIRLSAIQKSNLYHWMHKESRADRAVAELNAILSSRTAPPDRPDRGTMPT